MIPLIDTHQHLVYPDVAGYGWTAGIPVLADKAFTLETYQELADQRSVAATIFMETGVDDADYKAEARFAAELAGRPSSRIIGLIASCRPESDEGYEAWLDECAGLNVVGFRRILHVMPDDLSQSETFRRNIREIGRRGLVFDMCFLAAQLPIALELAKACDNTSLVLDHCGVPDIAGGGLDPWRAHIGELAALPNVTCKLSGVLAYCAAGEASLDAIRPYVDHVIETFGPGRIVWGSDWPVVDMANGLPDWLAATRTILEGLSEDEAAQIAQENTKRVYKVSV
ncbi:amidohydrolase family protein [Hoeflea poritis]|uniref:Amidohydrolase n=1 Tax=Hoeflea poritis TaxID=2993659 RepID=A0ABT4VLT0_9HYPH|nr:amidohydrolase [Hoeflea poritis]MDA4845003.1 amidohydrolase [Hoeflea poritis]